MEQINDSLKLNKYDRTNMKSLLQGGQIELLEMFCTSRNEDQITNLGLIYHFFSKYWPNELAQELRKNRRNINPKMTDSEVIDINEPLQFYSTKNYDWQNISKTISTLEAVRQKLIRLEAV
jgi:hypothetical protein